MAKDFAPDLPAAQTRVMAATQGQIAAKTFEENVSTAAWKTKPSWYIVAANDRMIQPDLERAMAKKIKATTDHAPDEPRGDAVAAEGRRRGDSQSRRRGERWGLEADGPRSDASCQATMIVDR